MSGQQIGTVVGGVIGAYFGGPAGAQLGMAIGGAIGGAVDPEHIYGPKIGDGQQQSATDGAPIAWVQGTAMIAGTIVQVSPRRQVRHKTGGKGGGPVQVTYTAVQDFAILVCESSEIRGSTVSQILMVFQDGKLVYDVRPGSTILSQSYKWKANVDFLFGGEDQMPHPTLEAITGVGNTPAYRGSCVAVFKNFDVSAAGERIPSFQFVVATSGSPALLIPYDDANWKYSFANTTAADFSSPSYDDSSWAIGRGGFAGSDGAGPVLGAQTVNTVGPPSDPLTTMWMRRTINATPGVDLSILAYRDNTARLWWNGVLVLDDGADGSSSYASSTIVIPGADVLSYNVLAYRVCESTNPLPNYSYMSLQVSQAAVTAGATTLSQIVSNICARGGLSTGDVDATALSGQDVAGYPIARQANAADCLLPLLQAYFAYGSEYEAKLAFQFYGQNAVVTVSSADLLEGNDANEGAIKKNLRNQATEFPRRIVGKYMDPAQNYMVVTTAAERRSIDVLAIGDQSFDIPVVMPANDATRAVDKALKVAYATLEGKLEYSIPFADSDVYLALAAGEPLLFNGKRWIADEVILSTGYLKLTIRYDRQSAYTSTVQAIAGNAPTPPASPYSGPTTLVVMDLPALRPQDSYGAYLAAGSTDNSSSWRGCTVQVSYDGQATWQTALTINGACSVGVIESASPFRVLLNNETLESATDAQLAANANVFGIVGTNGVTELAQFTTATSTGTDLEYDIDGINRGLAGTTVVADPSTLRFATLDYAYFLPIDRAFAGRTIYLRAVGFGENEADATIETLVYTAKLYDAGVSLVAENGTALIAENDADLLYSEKTP